MEGENFYRWPIVLRLLGAVGGFWGGGFIGIILLVLIIMISDFTFGLTTIWPGAWIGSVTGAIIGFFFPKAGKCLSDTLSSL
jgi:integral membrane sensor domain MASE1